jgi:uncharacterized membrane protein YkvA (DUF1232 family)
MNAKRRKNKIPERASKCASRTLKMRRTDMVSSKNKIRTIGDLNRYMILHELSPEALARKVLLSNMTIRRMLRLKASEKISEKYWPLFDQLSKDSVEPAHSHFQKISSSFFTDFKSLTQDLEKAGTEAQNIDQIKEDACSKMNDEAIGTGLKTSIKVLLNTVSGSNTSLRSRAIAIGALIYFVNPFDLIPDALVGVGYLDDMAVASVAISAIATGIKTSRKTKLPY